MRTIPLLLALSSGVVAACATETSAPDGDPSDARPSEQAAVDRKENPNARTLPLDAKGCIDLTKHQPKPITLTGRLVITYNEPSLENMCDWDDESKTYWCPETTQVSAQCAEVGGTFWCPNATPPPERIGDPQELASFDLANASGGAKRWTTNTVHEAELDVSPDGKKVVYAVRARMDAFEEGDGIWVSDSDGKNARKVVDKTGHTGIPTWIPPSNDRFTYISDGLHVFDLISNQSAAVPVDGFDPGLIIDPEASHDGKKITFKADASGGNVPVIYVMDFDGKAGTNVRQLTRGFSDHDPVFSRDNRKIYFERYYGKGEWDQYEDRLANVDANKWGIVEVDAATAKERVLVPHDACGKHFFWLPTVSPDGRYLMFIHDYVAEDGYQDLWVSDLDGGDAQPVPGTRGFHWFDWTQ